MKRILVIILLFIQTMNIWANDPDIELKEQLSRFESLKLIEDRYRKITLDLDQFYEELYSRELLFRNTILLILESWYDVYNIEANQVDISRLEYLRREISSLKSKVETFRIDPINKQFIGKKLDYIEKQMEEFKLIHQYGHLLNGSIAQIKDLINIWKNKVVSEKESRKENNQYQAKIQNTSILRIEFQDVLSIIMLLMAVYLSFELYLIRRGRSVFNKKTESNHDETAIGESPYHENYSILTQINYLCIENKIHFLMDEKLSDELVEDDVDKFILKQMLMITKNMIEEKVDLKLVSFEHAINERGYQLCLYGDIQKIKQFFKNQTDYIGHTFHSNSVQMFYKSPSDIPQLPSLT